MAKPAFLTRRALLALLSGAAAPALPVRAAGELFVIAHPAAGLSPESIRDVYIGEKQFSGAVKLVPMDNAAAQADFLAKVMKLEAARYESLWVKKSFRDALNPPLLKGSDREIIDLVRKMPGAVGYLGSSPPEGVLLVQRY